MDDVKLCQACKHCRSADRSSDKWRCLSPKALHIDPVDGLGPLCSKERGFNASIYPWGCGFAGRLFEPR